MTLIKSHAVHHTGTDTRAGMTRVDLCACIAVVARGSIGGIRGGALASRDAAYTGNVTLIERGAGDRILANTRSALARVSLGALVPVVAGRAGRLLRVSTLPRDTHTL